MRIPVWLGLLLALSCGSEQRSASSAPPVLVAEPVASAEMTDAAPPSALPASENGNIEDVALRFYRAMFAGDTETATELAITFEEMRSLTKKPIEREEFDAALRDFVKPHDSEMEPTEVVRVEVVERGVLRTEENEKITRDLEYALVRPILRRDGQEAPWMARPFFKTENGWKFSPKK